MIILTNPSPLTDHMILEQSYSQHARPMQSNYSNKKEKQPAAQFDLATTTSITKEKTSKLKYKFRDIVTKEV